MYLHLDFGILTTIKYDKGDVIVEYTGDCIDFKEGVEGKDKQKDRKTLLNFLFFVGKYCQVTLLP